MGLKMFLSFLEVYAGADAFRKARPVLFVIGRVEERIDAKGNDVFMIGSCSHASVDNAKKVIRIGRCFTTASDVLQVFRTKLGMPSPLFDPSFSLPLLGYILRASTMKTVKGRYLQDMAHFVANSLMRKL